LIMKFLLDGREVEAAPGQTILGAAREVGVDIPALCFLEKCGPATSCLVCLVKLNGNGQGKLVPACATRVCEGMVVESETPDVHEARRTALELLLSDHVGDCLSPCHRICPLHLNIPKMLRKVETGDLAGAIAIAREAVAFPAIVGRLCHHPCENGCRRGTWDSPAAIRDLERHVGDEDLASDSPFLPACHPASGKSVAIVGAGPTGLMAAYQLLRLGHACTVLVRGAAPGGTLLSNVTEAELPRDILKSETGLIQRMGGVFQIDRAVTDADYLTSLTRQYDAVLLAIGSCSRSEGEPLGLEMTSAGIKIDAARGLTSVDRVFAAGSAVKPVKQLVRAMREGQGVADCMHAWLSGTEVRRRDKSFSSVMGRLDEQEVGQFMKWASQAPRTEPSCGTGFGFSRKEAGCEASRCMHCDCRAVDHCKLRYYAEQYDADPAHFRSQRRRFEQRHRPGEVIFESGKCILCGICLKIAEQAREPLGLTFVGRGFDVQVGVPFGDSFAAGLQKTAAECVEHCPSGALTLNDLARDCREEECCPQPSTSDSVTQPV
jgi:ferredoxin